MLGDAAKEIAVYPGARFITAHSVPADRRMRIVLLFESHDAVSRVLDDYKSKIPDAGGHFETPSGSESGHLTYEDGTRTLEIVVAAEQGTNTIIAVTLV